MRRMLLVWIACFLLTLTVSAAPPLQQDAAAQGTAQITAFTTTASGVSRDDLTNRTARIPVAWVTVNRPLTANLVFEQVLPSGSTVNVELPRLLPWVTSNGQGVAAPIAPSGNANQIVIRVRLVNLINGNVLSERQLTLPIVQGGSSGSVGDRPSITSFITSSTFVNTDQLQNGSARIPVSWATANRPSTANLAFEQVLADGSAVNVELPRDNPFVPSSGNGMTVPVAPGGSSTTVTLRVSLFDLINGRVYDLREITVPMLPAGATPTAAPTSVPMINYYRVNVQSVNAAELANGTARITVSWDVANRPPNSNLFFEQVLANGTVQNVELPRQNPIVGSSGNGLIAPVAPGGSAQNVRFSLSLVGLDNFRLYDQEIVTVPIGTTTTATPTPTGQSYNLSFSTTVSSVDRQALGYGTARIPVSWSVSPRPNNSNLFFEQVLANGTVRNVELPRPNPIVGSSGNGVVAPALPFDSTANQIVVRVRLADLANPSSSLAQRELIIPITNSSVTVTPIPRQRFDLTLPPNAAINGAQIATAPVIVPISWVVSPRPNNSNLVFEQVFPSGVALNAELPRPNPIVPSEGTGAVRVSDPGASVGEVRVRVRMVDLGTNVTLDSREITIPISGRGSGGGSAIGLEATQDVSPQATPEAIPEATDSVSSLPACEFAWFISNISGCPAEASQQITVTTQQYGGGTMLYLDVQAYFLGNDGSVTWSMSATLGQSAPSLLFEGLQNTYPDLVGEALGTEGTYTATVQHGELDEFGRQDILATLSDGRTVVISGAAGQQNSWREVR